MPSPVQLLVETGQDAVTIPHSPAIVLCASACPRSMAQCLAGVGDSSLGLLALLLLGKADRQSVHLGGHSKKGSDSRDHSDKAGMGTSSLVKEMLFLCLCLPGAGRDGSEHFGGSPDLARGRG